jgi:hypothetical protein
MKYLRNPTTAVVTYCTPLAAKKLARYGWVYVKREDWVAYQRAQIHLAMSKHIPQSRRAVGSVH